MKHKELQNLWSQYFKESGKLKTIRLKIDHHSLKRKAVYSIFIRLIENEHILEDMDLRKSNCDDDLKKITLKKFMVKIAI